MVRNMISTNPDYVFIQINREKNSKEDELYKLVQNDSDLGSSVYLEELLAPNIEREELSV